MPTGSDYVPYTCAGWVGLRRDDCPRSLLTGDPLHMVSSSEHEMIRDRPAARTMRLYADGQQVYLKHIIEGRRSRTMVRRNLAISRQLNDAGFRTPPILLAGWRGSGADMQGLLVTQAVDERTLQQFVAVYGLEQELKGVLRMAGRRIAHLHRQRFIHGDLLPGNLLVVRDENDLVFLDNDRTRRWPIWPPAHVRSRNIAQMLFRLMLFQPWRVVRVFLLSYFEATGIPERRRRVLMRDLLLTVQGRFRRRELTRNDPPTGRIYPDE